jgi:hypothetical protein
MYNFASMNGWEKIHYLGSHFALLTGIILYGEFNPFNTYGLSFVIGISVTSIVSGLIGIFFLILIQHLYERCSQSQTS